MTLILNFQKFINESALNLPEVAEFKDAFENSEWGKILSTATRMDPKKTGRIYLHSHYLPAKTQVEKKNNQWVSWYTSAGRDYGYKYMPSAEVLIRELVYNSIRKGNQSIPRNELESFLNDHGTALKVLSQPNVTVGHPKDGEISAYEAIKGYGAGESGIISDLSDISTPYLEFLKQEGFTVDSKGKDLEISFKDLSIIPVEDQQWLPPFFKDIKEIIERSGSSYLFERPHHHLIFEFKKYGFAKVKITASGEGTIVQKGTTLDIITLGYTDKEKLTKEIDSVLKKHMPSTLKLSIGKYYTAKPGSSEDKALDVLRRETRRFFKEGSSVNIGEEKSRYLIARLRMINKVI